jgi:hypothetical protein
MVNRCPECGTEFDPSQLPLARVPWLYRRRLGGMSNSLQTMGFILLRPVAFARELSRPVRISRDDAWRFRRVTVFLGVAGVIVFSLIVAYARIPAAAWQDREAFRTIVLAAGPGPVLLWYFLLLCTDMPTFIWKGLPYSPDDLAPLHYYTAAPLFLLTVLSPVAAAAVLYHPYAAVVAGVGVLLVVVLLWSLPLTFMRATGASLGPVVMLAVYLPVHWALIGVAGGMIYISVLVIVFGLW